MLKTRLLALLVSSLGLAACGGGGGDGINGDEGSGLDGSRTLDTLTDEERVQLCEYSESLQDLDAGPQLRCYLIGIFQSSEGGNCQEIADACIATAEPASRMCESAAELEYPECASLVSVSEMETCKVAQVTQLNSNSISCDSTDEEVSEAINPSYPAACAPAQEKCPALFGDGSQ
jgi:hypothetical protein